MDSIITHTLNVHRGRFRKVPGNTTKIREQIAQEEDIHEKTRVNQENFKQTDILKINTEEAKMITEYNSPEDILNTLSKNKIRIVILTQGKEGVHIIKNKKRHYLPFKKKINIKDTTGAGDILAGAFMAKYLETKDEVDALCTASATVRVALTKRTINKIPELNEIEVEKNELINSIISE